MKPLDFRPNLSIRENKELREEFTNRVANRIGEIRKSKKITQQKLAEAANLHLTYVGHLEQAKYHPTAFVLWKIAKALDVSIAKLTNI